MNWKQTGTTTVVSFCQNGDGVGEEREGIQAGLPQSGKNIWKMHFFPGQGKVREFCGWPGKVGKDLESQGKVREFENKWLWQAVFRKFIYSVQEGKGCFLR